jgi:GNAT superfamily N-acetyltransferase
MDFRLVDIRVEMQISLPGVASPGEGKVDHDLLIRTTRARDLPALEDIAAQAHQDSRFFFDEGFPAARCRQLYALWVRKSYQGFADRVMTALVEGRPVGYIALHREAPSAGRIGLVGVLPSRRGRGIGQALLKDALGWFAQQGMVQARVTTQGRNLASQRLYQRCGFRVCEMGLWYHKWFHKPGPGEG